MSDAKQSPVTRRRLEKELPTDLTKKAETEQVETEQAGIDKRRPSNEIVIVVSCDGCSYAETMGTSCSYSADGSSCCLDHQSTQDSSKRKPDCLIRNLTMTSHFGLVKGLPHQYTVAPNDNDA